jgi:predicted lipoprotein with Yx(FWY)xxD motif
MLKKSQRGFAAVEALLIIVIVGLIAFVAWYAFNTKSSTDETLNNAANSQISPTKKNNKQTSTNSESSSQAVTTKSDSKQGQYLADKDGKTLYTYGADTSGVSNCTGSCMSTWPPYTATSTNTYPSI